MLEFYESGSVPIWIWFVGAGILGLALAYSTVRAGWLRREERLSLDRRTEMQQISEGRQQTAGDNLGRATSVEQRELEIDRSDRAAAMSWGIVASVVGALAVVVLTMWYGGMFGGVETVSTDRPAVSQNSGTVGQASPTPSR